jgi:uracil-DNA glycosylase
LNTALTVKQDQPMSHSLLWVRFTESVVQALLSDKSPRVWMLWGAAARSYAPMIQPYKKHLILESGHPVSRGEFRAGHERHFTKANAWLRKHNLEEIQW